MSSGELRRWAEAVVTPRAVHLLAFSLLLTACSYKAEVLDAPSYNVVSSYGEKIPGKWLLYVEAAPLDKPTKPTGYACSFHTFPIAAAGSFETSVKQTLVNVVEHIEVVQGGVTRDKLAAYGARGLIVVRGEEIRSKLDVQPGFWTANMATEAVIIASISVDGRDGRLFGESVEGRGVANTEAGMMCEGGAKSLAEAVGQAMRDTMRKIGEGLSNSERIRTSRV